MPLQSELQLLYIRLWYKVLSYYFARQKLFFLKVLGHRNCTSCSGQEFLLYSLFPAVYSVHPSWYVLDEFFYIFGLTDTRSDSIWICLTGVSDLTSERIVWFFSIVPAASLG